MLVKLAAVVFDDGADGLDVIFVALFIFSQVEASKGPRRRKKTQAGGRRKFGTVRDATVTVTARAGGEMRVRDIHLEVQKVLRGRVSRFSVADYLRTRSQPPKPLFARTRHGHYTLLG